MTALAERTATTGDNDLAISLLQENHFTGKSLKADFTIAKTGGNINNKQYCFCDGATYLLSVVDKSTTIGCRVQQEYTLRFLPPDQD